MNTLESFMSNCLVVKLDSYADILRFVQHAKKIGLERVKDLYRINKGEFSWMELNISYSELCIEYQIGKGFTISGKTDNLNYGNTVISLDEFINKTSISNFIDKDYVEIFEEVKKLPEKINYVLLLTRISDKRYTFFKSSGSYTVTGTRRKGNEKVFKTKQALLNALDKIHKFGLFDYYEGKLIHPDDVLDIPTDEYALL